jgi:3-oxoacyl-(acyl-carrier-protein) synthase
MKHNQQRRVVITGLGVIAPNGLSISEFWDNCTQGVSGVKRLDRFSVQRYNSKIAGMVNMEVFAKQFPEIAESTTLDSYVKFALACTEMAWNDSGLSLQMINSKRLGVSIATAIGATLELEQEFIRLTDNGSIDMMMHLAKDNLLSTATFNTATETIAHTYKAFGPSLTMVTGCTAGLDAMGYSLDVIRRGDADIMITGASETPLTPIALSAFDVIGALSSKNNDNPTHASRPYDLGRDGFVLAEGCGILVFEELNHALARNAHILAEVKGFASTSNAYHMTDLPSDGKDLLRSLSLALEDANITPEQIDYISSHGSSTAQNDVNESSAYKKLIGDRVYEVPISSLKSMIGHSLSASNAIESIASIMTINTGIIHPTINFDVPGHECDLFYVPNKAIKKTVNHILKNASGFSGIHSALIIGRYV